VVVDNDFKGFFLDLGLLDYGVDIGDDIFLDDRNLFEFLIGNGEIAVNLFDDGIVVEFEAVLRGYI
jgi:hypothetical protein